jgi:hypothetical protein
VCAVELDTNTNDNKLWHQQHEKLVELKRKKGNCPVPREHNQDKSLGIWVSHQQTLHNNSKLRLDRKMPLDELDFVWKVGTRNIDINDMLWQKQRAKLVEFKRKSGHCRVPHEHEQDESLGLRAAEQSQAHQNVTRPKESSGRNWVRLRR